jgi:hypothetical protein
MFLALRVKTARTSEEHFRQVLRTSRKYAFLGERRGVTMRYKVIVNALLSLALGLSSAYAESFVIRPDGGSVQLTLDFEGDWFRFVGQSFSVDIDTRKSLNSFFPRVDEGGCGDLCRAGDVLDMSFHTPGEVLLGARGAGSATFGATSYSDLTLAGTLAFEVDPIIFPSTNAELFFYQSPFSFHGFLRGTTAAGNEVFAADFTGVGHVGRYYDARGDGAYISGGENQTVYAFDAPVSQTPEPATMLLLATGGVPLALRARRRREDP